MKKSGLWSLLGDIKGPVHLVQAGSCLITSIFQSSYEHCLSSWDVSHTQNDQPCDHGSQVNGDASKV